MPDLVFGPIPSRRLGRSLGVNTIPPKTCSYSCVYCQVGRTTRSRVTRRSFYEPEAIGQAVRARVESVRADGGRVDHLTFVPDGEPTLDENLGATIEELAPLGIPIAVITNSSLLADPEVRRALDRADWVSVKVDAADESVWTRIDRPSRRLDFASLTDGLRTFAREYTGTLVTETMLVSGVNDDESHLRALADLVADLRASASYLAIPTRPPAEPWVRAPDEAVVTRAYGVFAGRAPGVEYLTGYEGDAFASTGDARADLLSITAVHPMRRDAVDALLEKTGTDRRVVDILVAERLLSETTYGGHTYYVRRFTRRR